MELRNHKCNTSGNSPKDTKDKDTTEMSVFSELVFLLVKENGALSEFDGQCTYKALRVADGSARYARSHGRMERNDRCGRWSNIFMPKQATCECQQLDAPGKQPGRRMLARTYSFDMYEREITARHGTARHTGSRQLCLLACVVAL